MTTQFGCTDCGWMSDEQPYDEGTFVELSGTIHVCKSHDARNGRPAPHVDFGEPSCRGCAGPVRLPGLTEADDLPLCTAHWNQWLIRFLGADDAPPCRAHLIREPLDSEVTQ